MTVVVDKTLYESGFTVGPGLRIRVRVVRKEGEEFLDVRQFNTDTGKYLRGVPVPVAQLGEFREACDGAYRYLGLDQNHAPGPGQGTLF